MRLAKPCQRLPREVVGSPSLQIFEMRQDVSELSNVISLSTALRSYRLPEFSYSIPVSSIPWKGDFDCKAEGSTILPFVRGKFLHYPYLYKLRFRFLLGAAGKEQMLAAHGEVQEQSMTFISYCVALQQHFCTSTKLMFSFEIHLLCWRDLLN